MFATLNLGATPLLAASAGRLELAPTCAPTTPPEHVSATTRALEALFADDAMREDSLDPLGAVYSGDVSDTTALARIFTDSLEADRMVSARHSLSMLAIVDPCALPEDLRLSRTLFERAKQAEIAQLRPDTRAFAGMQPLNPFQDVFEDIPVLVAPGSAFAYESPEDYRKVLVLYRALPTLVDTAIARFREGMAQGVVEPERSVRTMLEQLDQVLDRPDPWAPFLLPLTTLPDTVSPAEARTLRAEFDETTRSQVLPAYQRLRRFLKDEYLPHARTSIGLSDLPGGEGAYAARIEAETTLPLSADDVHELGLREVARIETEMTRVARELGNTASLPEFFAAVREDPRFHPSSAEELQARYEAVADAVEAQLPRFFAQLPLAPLVIEPYPSERAPFEPGGSYSGGGLQSGRPAIFFYNASDLAHRFLSETTTLYLHEGLPGHHLQVSLALEAPQLPAFQRYGGNTAFVEGWALYAETLGYDMGLYTDPLQHWGTLDDEMLRAMRLVVDTGIHARHWSRDEAVAYMLAHSGMGRSDAEIEVERYIALPAQALAYKIGALEIQNLRREAETRLGARFDISAFHQQVLGSGALPLDILHAKLENWIAAQEALPPARPIH